MKKQSIIALIIAMTTSLSSHAENLETALAKAYEDETGVEVKVVTAAAGTYESTLTAELDKDDAPTLFQINGAVGYNSWKNYCSHIGF